MTQISKDLEATAQSIYAKLQSDYVPTTFKRPEDFVQGQVKDIDYDANPQQLLYRTTNSQYGNFHPSQIEMPSVYHGKNDKFVKMQNFQVYRSTRMNCECDKNRYMDPWTQIRRK